MIKNRRLLLLILIIFTLLILIPSSFAFESDNSTDIDYKMLSDDNIDEIEKLDNQEAIIADVGDDAYNDVIYVSVDGDDSNNGSEEAPISSINKAIELASGANNTAHKIIISNGTYVESDLEIASNLEITAMGNVIIDGNKKSSILTIDTTKEVKISGVTFQNAWGGAITINDAKVTIDNCIFVNNTSDYGGAIYWNGEDGILSNSYFTQNHARVGSAVVWGGREESGEENKANNGLIVNVTIDNNDNRNSHAGSMGIAILSDNVRVINSSFINNHAPHVSTGGALHIYGENILVDGCLFENNTMDQAPAIQCDGDNAIIINSKFINNTIYNPDYVDSGRSGAIDVQSPNAYISNNTFIGNGGENCFNGGAITVTNTMDYIINISNNTFINNSAKYGAGIFVEGNYETYYYEFESIILNNNIFDGNEAYVSTAGIYVRNADIENTLINIENNQFKNLIANHASAIFIDYASALLKNNTISNCTSLDENNQIFNNDGYISGNLTVIVNNNDTVELLAGKSINVCAKVYDDMNNSISGGTIRFIVEGSDVDENGFSLENGTAVVNFHSTVEGFYTVSADYTNGDLANIKTCMVVALPYDIVINFNNESGLCGEEISVPVLVLVNFEPLDNENITIKFNNETFNATVLSGEALIVLKLPEENGTYDLTITYDIKDVTKTIMVKDNHVILTVPQVNVTPNAGSINITLTDIEKIPLVGENITVIIDNTTGVFKTDDNGSVIIPLNLSLGNYSVTAIFNGNKYKPAQSSSTIIVDYLDVILTSEDINMIYNDGTSYIVRLTDTGLNPIANQSIVVTLNGKTYDNLKTDANGVVTLLITLNTGTYSITSRYDGNNIYDSSIITNKIVIKSYAKLKASNVVAYFFDLASYKVRLYGDDGKAVGSGKIIKIRINGKTYSRKTDKNGYAILKIKLNPKTYKITATYNKLKVTNNFIVKPILSAKNLLKKNAKTIKFSAKLAKGTKPIANKIIKFKVNGKAYSAKTDKKGIATANLNNLKIGKNIIYSFYSTSKVKNIITIKK